MDVLRLYSFKGDALSWSVRGVGTSGPPQRPYSQRNTVGVEARRRGGGRGGRRRRRNRAFTGTITTTHWLTSRDHLRRRFHYTDDINHFGRHKLHHLWLVWLLLSPIGRFMWNIFFVDLLSFCTSFFLLLINAQSITFMYALLIFITLFEPSLFYFNV